MRCCAAGFRWTASTPASRFPGPLLVPQAAPGLLLSAAAEHGVDPRLSFMVGDRWSDIAAGQAAGCRSILINRPYSDAGRCSPDAQVADLTEAAEWVASFTDRQNMPLAI